MKGKTSLVTVRAEDNRALVGWRFLYFFFLKRFKPLKTLLESQRSISNNCAFFNTEFIELNISAGAFFLNIFE